MAKTPIFNFFFFFLVILIFFFHFFGLLFAEEGENPNPGMIALLGWLLQPGLGQKSGGFGYTSLKKVLSFMEKP